MTVLDAYAVVAYFVGERAQPHVADVLSSGECALTAVGLAEVIDRIVRVEGFAREELAADLRRLALADPIVIDETVGVQAGQLRARHYHRRTRAVSMADCVAATAARLFDEPLATSDPHLLDLCHEEQIPTIVLPGSDGSSWAPA